MITIKRSHNPSPLWHQMIVIMLVSMVLVTITASIFQYQTEYRIMQGLLERQNEKNFHLIYPAVRRSVFLNDAPELQRFIKQLSEHDQDLYQLVVTRSSGNKLIDWRRPGTSPRKPVIALHKNISLNGKQLATLEVSWSVDRYYSDLNRKIFFSQMFLAFSLFLLTIILLYLLLKRVVKPLENINNLIQAIDSDTSIYLPPIADGSQEIIQLSEAIFNLINSYQQLVLTKEVLNKAKQQIENLNRRNTNILNAAGEGIFVINKKGVTIFMNLAGTKMTGWTTNEITGKHFSRLMAAANQGNQNYKFNDAEKKQNESQGYVSLEEYSIHNTLEQGKTLQVSYATFKSKKGSFFPVEYISAPIMLEEGNIVGAVVTFKDISERLKADEKLRESQALKQAMLESSNDAIITVDDQGLIREFNKVAEQMFGYVADSVIGKQLELLIIPQYYREKHQQSLFQTVKTGNKKTTRKKIQLSALRRSGEEFPVEMVITPITLNNKLFFTAFISDITERKQVKEAMEKARQNAENANLAKSRFLATMSHEIRTPLSALVGVQDLLLTTELTVEQSDYLAIAQQSAQTLQDVINDILDFSKIEAGKLILEFKETDPMEIVDSVLSVMASKALEKNIELMCSCSYPLPQKALLDPVRTKQILYNLVGNAIKFTHQGWIRVHLSLTTVNKQDLILFEVIDTGIGISDESQTRLFDEFTQADLSTTRKYGGTGLGLAITSRLVKMCNGEIKVKSKLGKGSNFSFSLGPVTPPFYQPEPITKLHCWIVMSSQQSTLVLYEQLKGLVADVTLIDSIYGIRPYNDPSILIIDNEQLQQLTPNQLQSVLSRQQSNCKTILITDINQRRLLPEWQELIDRQLSKPLLFSKIIKTIQNCATNQEPAADSARTLMSVPEKPNRLFDNPLIMLAEDSELIQRVTKNMLKKLNCRVDIADNGVIAAQKAERQQYDLILMDLSMPEMGGLETTHKIRNSDGINQNTPIVALTANAFKEDYNECRKAGMNGFLTKPLTFDSLQTELLRLLNDKDPKPETDSPYKIDKAVTDYSETAGSDVLIDHETLKRLREEMSKELFPKMIDLFIEQGELRINKIETAIQQKDFESLAHEIHTLKSESTTFGAIKLGAITSETNRLCKLKQRQQAFEFAAKAKNCWQETIADLRKNLVA